MNSPPKRLRSLPSWHLVQAASRAGSLIAERSAKLGVSKAVYPALAALEEFGAASQADLGRRLGIDRKDVSALAAELERSGYVTRGPDPADVRRNQLAITSAGRTLLNRLDAAFTEVQHELFGALSASERTTLTRLLIAVATPSA